MTPGKPKWLPEIVSVDGVPAKVFAMLYGIFEKDFKKTQPAFSGRPVWWDRRILPGDSYEEGFWHLITETNKSSGERLLDPRRAERLPWCGPTIRHSDDVLVKVWNYLESSNRIHTYLWIEDSDYVVILHCKPARLGEIAFLVTAFHLDGDSRRRNLRRKYENRIR